MHPRPRMVKMKGVKTSNEEVRGEREKEQSSRSLAFFLGALRDSVLLIHSLAHSVEIKMTVKGRFLLF